MFCLLLITEVADLISGRRRNRTYVKQAIRKILLCQAQASFRSLLDLDRCPEAEVTYYVIEMNITTIILIAALILCSLRPFLHINIDNLFYVCFTYWV